MARRCGLQQHQACRGTGLPERQPVRRRCHAATGPLRPKACRVEGGIDHLHLVPVNVELVGDQHGQHRLDTLANFRVFAGDDHSAIHVQCYPDGKRGTGDAGWRAGLCHAVGQRRQCQLQYQPTAHERGGLQKGSTAHSLLGHQDRIAGRLHVSSPLDESAVV